MRLLLACALLCATATLASAQAANPPSPAPAPAAESEVRSAVVALFDAMRAADGPAAAALFHPQARLLSVGVQQGVPTLRAESVAGFVEAVGTPRAQLWDERLANLRVQVDGSLAAAWMEYAFFVDDRFSHCGVNAFHFFRDAEGWRILQIVDTRRRDGCEEIQRVARRDPA